MGCSRPVADLEPAWVSKKSLTIFALTNASSFASLSVTRHVVWVIKIVGVRRDSMKLIVTVFFRPPCSLP